MKVLVLCLVVLFALLQLKLWVDGNGVSKWIRLKNQTADLLQTNQVLSERNQLLQSQVGQLKAGSEGLEEYARAELGFIKPGEIYYQVLPDSCDQKARVNG